jgi:hypothetical protein
MTLTEAVSFATMGMEGGADTRARRDSRAQRGIEQEGPVVIDRNQHVRRLLRIGTGQNPHIDRAGFVTIKFGLHRDRDIRQRIGLP